MSDHGWKSMLARIRRWLASPVRVEFNPRAGTGFGRRAVSVTRLRTDEPAPRRREPIRFRAPVSRPGADRRHARESEYERLRDEIDRLTRRSGDAPAASG